MLARIEYERRHAELTPRFRVTVDDGGSGSEELLVLRMKLMGPAGLDHVDSLTVRIRDDNYRRWTGGLPIGATEEQVAKCIWGPYRLIPHGTVDDNPHVDEVGRFGEYNIGLPVGEEVALPLEPTLSPPWLHRSQEDWQRYWRTPGRFERTIRVAIEARLAKRDVWNLPYEVKLGPGRRGVAD